MLRKCLKYDLKSMFTYWIFGAITLLALSFSAGLALRSQINNIKDMGNRFNWEILVLILYYFAIAAFLLLGSILIYVRYYKHFFSDEGYLTFTLPVKRRTLYTSKVLNGAIYQAASYVIVLISIIIMVLFIPSSGNSVPSTPSYSEPIKGVFWIFMCVLEVLAILIIYAFLSVISMYLVITIGANIVRKNKILATIGIVYASGMVLSFVSYVLAALGALYVTSAITSINISISNAPLFVFLLLALAIVVLLTITVSLAMVTLHILERKLNLA